MSSDPRNVITIRDLIEYLRDEPELDIPVRLDKSVPVDSPTEVYSLAYALDAIRDARFNRAPAEEGPFEQWQAEVASGATMRGYVDWARNQA